MSVHVAVCRTVRRKHTRVSHVHLMHGLNGRRVQDVKKADLERLLGQNSVTICQNWNPV